MSVRRNASVMQIRQRVVHRNDLQAALTMVLDGLQTVPHRGTATDNHTALVLLSEARKPRQVTQHVGLDVPIGKLMRDVHAFQFRKCGVASDLPDTRNPPLRHLIRLRRSVEYDRLAAFRRPCDRITVGHEHTSGERVPLADFRDPFLIPAVDLTSREKAFEALRGAVDNVQREAVPNVRVVAVPPPHDAAVVGRPMPVLDDAVR